MHIQTQDSLVTLDKQVSKEAYKMLNNVFDLVLIFSVTTRAFHADYNFKDFSHLKA